MADVVLDEQQIKKDGLEPSYTSIDATDTYYAPNVPGKTFLHFKNTGGSASTVTFDLTKSVRGASLSDATVTVPATSGDVMVGPFPKIWEVGSGAQAGRLKFTQDQASGVSVALVRV